LRTLKSGGDRQTYSSCHQAKLKGGGAVPWNTCTSWRTNVSSALFMMVLNVAVTAVRLPISSSGTPFPSWVTT
jgi:hypothetical protein